MSGRIKKKLLKKKIIKFKQNKNLKTFLKTHGLKYKKNQIPININENSTDVTSNIYSKYLKKYPSDIKNKRIERKSQKFKTLKKKIHRSKKKRSKKRKKYKGNIAKRKYRDIII
jgi:hypothetical protein